MRSSRMPLATVAALAAVALATWSPAASAAVPGPSRVVTATPRDGVRLVGDLPVGPLGSDAVVSTLVEAREAWGPERTLTRRRCAASWGTGVRLLFTSFGGPSSCGERFLQVVYVTGPRWSVSIGQQDYAIGDPRSLIPPRAKFVPRWNGGGFQLATMPFIGLRTLSVMAHVNRRGRIDRFVLFIGAAGD
jgi:hypothetical protein